MYVVSHMCVVHVICDVIGVLYVYACVVDVCLCVVCVSGVFVRCVYVWVLCVHACGVA